MNYKSTSVLAGLLVALSLLVLVNRVHAREVLSLDGVWNFATDPDNRGEAENWYKVGAKLPKMPLPGYAATADGTIRVPGIWDNQGYGTETEKVRHNFVGKGWYRRQVDIPKEWAGRQVFLTITGASRYAKVWINGQFLGEHIGFLSTFEHDLTRYVAPGQAASITIQVDSKQRWEIDAMYGACTLADYMDVVWGGIWGHVTLEARSDAWLGDLFVQPDLAKSACSASATLNGRAGQADAAKLEVFDKNNRRVAEASLPLDPKATAGASVALAATIPDPQLWTPDTPTLYRARLSLTKGGMTLDSQETRFGMREFSRDGHRLLLNGKPIMLVGYGDDHIYPRQMAMPSDKELHLAQLRTIRSYGFNHVRHHSTMMPSEYYDACDELGMITTSEFPIVYTSFLPGTGERWKANVAPGTDPGPAIETYKREWAAGIKRYRNHASIICWVMGNEFYDGIPLRHDFQKIARELDPRRFFNDSDGVSLKVLDPKNDRDTLEMYYLQFMEWDDPVANLDKYKTPKPLKPSISHETSNFVTFSRPDLSDQFQHNFKPFWLTAGKAKLEKLGLSQEAGQWAEKSERLYALLQKSNMESIRRNPYLSGYHWWLFQDYWTTANGLVDLYFRPKSITKEEVLKYNNDVVLLQDGLQRTYAGKNRLSLRLRVSNFSPEPLQGDMVWEVKLGGQSLARKQLSLQKVPLGEVAEAAQIDVELPEVAAPAQFKVTAELAAGAKHFTNDWSSWVYPAVIRPPASPVPVFADVSAKQLLPGGNVRPLPTEGELSERAVYVVNGLRDRRVVNALDRGAAVVLLDGTDALTPRPITFRSSWWKAGDNYSRNHCGTVVYDHPVTRAMAPAGWCDDSWFDLLEGANKYVLETAPARPDVIIRALPSMAKIEDDAVLFEVGVGQGSLIVSGLNHQKAAGRPENEWLLTQLVTHAAMLPHPKAQWPVSFLTLHYAAPDGCVSGYRRLLKEQGEEAETHSYREDNAEVHLCRQIKPGRAISWETAPAPEKLPDGSVTFVFAGALGFSSEPKTEGFVLDINDQKNVLRFDLPAPERWESADQRVHMRFEARRSISSDTFGLFYLTVPRDMLKPGEPCRLSVRSLGSNSRRWFGLNLYSDAK